MLAFYIGLIATGFLFILIPHFTLPLGYVHGAAGAVSQTQCEIWYHPELYIGILIVILSLFAYRVKKILYAIIAVALLGLLQAFILRPVSYYTLSEIPIVILSQTVSIRAHLHIQATLIILSAVTILLAIIPIVSARKVRISRLSLVTISSHNITRRRFRSLALIVSVTIVLGAFFSDVFLSQSIENTLELGAGRLGADLMVVPSGEQSAARAVLLSGGPTMFHMNQDILEKIKKYPEIEKISPQLYVQPFSYKVCCIVENILIIAYDPDTDFTVAPWIQYALREKQQPSDIVVGRLVKFYPGQKIKIFDKELRVIASLEPTGLGYFDNSAFMPLEGARKFLRELKKRNLKEEIPSRQKILDESFSHLFPSEEESKVSIKDIDPDGISAIFIKVKDNVSIPDFSKKIIGNNKDVSLVNVKEATITIKRHLSSVLRAFFLPIMVLFIMGTLILGVVFSMSVNERQRELGLMRAVGATKTDVFKLVLYESLIISGIGCVFGILFGSSLIFLFKNKIMAALELLYIWPSPRAIFIVIIATVAASVFSGIVAGFYPAFRAAKMEPYHAIRSGEK